MKPVWIVDDDRSIRWVIENALSREGIAFNSFSSAQAGSKHVLFRTRAVRHITILRQRHRLALELQVVDDGPGVPDEIQDRIFNPLVSGREGGTGLGLSLAQTFVQYHKGVIEFESRPGRTIFRILLPLT